MKKLKFVASLLLAFGFLSACQAFDVPRCDGAGQWPASMAFTKLKNKGLLTNQTVEFEKTKVELVQSEKLADGLHRQVHSVTFFLVDGGVVQAFTVNNASKEECSMSDVDVYFKLDE